MKQKISLFLLFSICTDYLYSRSVVYNFRIAQITKEHVFEKENPQRRTLIGLLFDEVSKKRYNDIQLNYGGALSAFIYSFDSYFIRGDFAFSKIDQKSCNGHFSATQTDDFLLSGGKNFLLSTKTDLTLSALLGIPTHKVYALRGPYFGTGQWGIGTQLDALYRFNSLTSLIIGGRYVYFIPRHARDTSCTLFKFTQGNLLDFLIASKNIWGKHGLELGFTPRFSFGAKISPHSDDTIEKTNYIRTMWYAVYQYKFKTEHTLNRFLFNIASGFEPSPKKFGSQYLVFIWAAWDLKF